MLPQPTNYTRTDLVSKIFLLIIYFIRALNYKCDVWLLLWNEIRHLCCCYFYPVRYFLFELLLCANDYFFFRNNNNKIWNEKINVAKAADEKKNANTATTATTTTNADQQANNLDKKEAPKRPIDKYNEIAKNKQPANISKESVVKPQISTPPTGTNFKSVTPAPSQPNPPSSTQMNKPKETITVAPVKSTPLVDNKNNQADSSKKDNKKEIQGKKNHTKNVINKKSANLVKR